MATIKPFRGIRYNTEKIADLSAVIAPPYDIINRQGQDDFYDLSPHNIIRLEYGREKESDNPEENRYTRANRTFNRWLEENILILEEGPAFYLYRQSFTYGGTSYHRDGLIAALKVEPYDTGAVLPHERTLTRPKADRLALFRSCRANFSPIFTLFSDPQNRAEQICAPLREQPPLFAFLDREGQRHRLWGITTSHQQEALQDLIAPQPLLIADGHHRYETALNFSEEMAAGGGSGYGYALTIMASLQSPGLLMLPTHRLLSGLTSHRAGTLLEIASRSFDVQPHGLPQNVPGDAFSKELQKKGRDVPALGLILPDQVYCLNLKSAQPAADRAVSIQEPAVTEASPASRKYNNDNNLDVALLQELIIRPLLEGSPDGTAEQIISYTVDPQKVMDAVAAGKYQAGFILNPTPIEEVITRARRGEVMPQKSTYFYPKLPSGLVIYSLEKSI